MTEDPIGEEIPELLDQLEGSLNAPNVEALHAVHTQRQAARKRTLGAAGVFVALLALTGGMLALNRDDTTSTVTADDLVEPVGVEAVTDSSDDRGAVAEDSAPFEIGNPSSNLRGGDLRHILAAQTWRVGAVTGSSDGLESQSGTIRFEGSPLTNIATLTYTNGCEGSAYEIDWINESLTMVRSELAAVPTDPTVACVEATRQRVLTAYSWLELAVTSSSTLRMGTTCHPAGVCEPGGFWSVELIGTEAFEFPVESELAGSAVVAIEECANGSWLTFGGQRWLPWNLPSEWEGQGRVDVTVTIDGKSLIATDDAGNSARFGLDDGTPRPQPCNGFTLEQEIAPNAPDSTDSPTTTVPSNATTTTTAAAPTGPPSFAPSADLALSGQWDVVGMWNGGVPFDFGGFGGSIGIFGRSLNGNDGCNSHGGGLFYATADGQVQLEGGNSTLVGCSDNETNDLFRSGTFGASAWGRTSTGTLVLTNGTVVLEFVLTDTMPASTLQDVSAPLNTIWNSDQVGDYDSLSTDGSDVTLSMIVEDDRSDVAVVTIDDCGEFGFDATFEDDTEGAISFEARTDPNGAACVPDGDAATALEALARADYFAAAFGGVQLWDGPAALAIFADE